VGKPRRCRICRKHPPWRYKNCPPGVCKRCYHAEVWPDWPAARQQHRRADAIVAAGETLKVLPDGSVIGWDEPHPVLVLADGSVLPSEDANRLAVAGVTGELTRGL
jgi:hypothetical protein